MLVKLHLHGPLKKQTPDGTLTVVANNAYEAMNAMARMLGIRPHPIRGRQAFKISGYDTPDSLFEEFSEPVDLHVIPAFGGSGGLFRVIIGAVLVVVGVLTGQPWLIALGAQMFIGGLINLLFPAHTETQTNKYLGAPGNTTQIGTPIPLLFGRAAAAGQYLSYNIDALAN